MQESGFVHKLRDSPLNLLIISSSSFCPSSLRQPLTQEHWLISISVFVTEHRVWRSSEQTPNVVLGECDGFFVVGDSLGICDGSFVVGDSLGVCDGSFVIGESLGVSDGSFVVGDSLGDCDGSLVDGDALGICDGSFVVGDSLGFLDEDVDGLAVPSLLSHILAVRAGISYV